MSRKRAVLYRKPANEEYCMLHKFISLLYGDHIELPKGTPYKTCIDSICFIHVSSSKLDTWPRIIYGGAWVGVEVGSEVFPSPPLYTELFRRYGVRGAIAVSRRAIEIFLYGGDIFASSVDEVYKPLARYTAVLDRRDGVVVGVARAPPWPEDRVLKCIANKEDKPIFTNIFHIGLFLRIFG